MDSISTQLPKESTSVVPQELEKEVELLHLLGYEVELTQEGQRVYVLFKNFELGPKFVPSRSDLLVYTSIEYPNAGFDMFWVDPVVKLANGGVPQGGDQIESYLGRQWRRFSWHLNRSWNPSKDSLRTWISHVEARLSRGV